MELEKSDILYLYLCDTTFLDLMELLTAEQLKKFILIFGGTTITVPSIADIKNCGRDFRIYNYVKSNITKGGNTLQQICLEASKLFHCSSSHIMIIYNNIKKYSDRLKETEEKFNRLSF